MPVALPQIKNELLPGLFDVRGQYEGLDRKYDKVFKRHTSEQAFERSTQMAFLGLAQLKNDGSSTQFDTGAGERFSWNFEHIGYGLGYAFTRNAIDDNLYKTQFNPMNMGLQKSFLQTKENIAANIFNNGTTAIAGIGGDGKALFATDHPYDLGTWANKPTTDLDLNETSLLQSILNIRANFVDERGLKIYARAKKLLVPVQLIPVAERLLKTELRPGTANNDVNVILSKEGGLMEDYMVWDYLTSNFAWFIQTDHDGLIHMERIPFEMDMQVDFTTDNLLVKGFERYSFGYNDPRAVYGSFPTS